MEPYIASHLKDMNRKTVYNLISDVGEISKAEIGRQTGISSPTVIKIVKFLLETNIVTEAGEGESALGRKPHILRFNPCAFYSIGVNFEGDFLKIGVVDLAGNLIKYRQYHVVPDFNDIISSKLKDYIQDIIKQADIPESKVLGVGIGIPGVVDPKKCIVEFAPLVGITEKLDYYDMLQQLSDQTGLPIYFENDVNMAALGEFSSRKLKPEDDLAYISIGTGLGAGIILDGKLRRGNSFFAGEIGYMVFDKNYTAVKTLPGWMENWINIKALSLRWDFFGSKEFENEKGLQGNLESRNMLIDHVASNLALCIANMVALIDVRHIVIGGIVEDAIGPTLVDRINDYLTHLCVIDVKCETRQCPEPVVVGAASMITRDKMDKILNEE